MLFLAMQVRVMADCMESQIDKQEYTASAQSRARDGTGGINQPSDVCVQPVPGLFCHVDLHAQPYITLLYVAPLSLYFQFYLQNEKKCGHLFSILVKYCHPL